MCVVHHCSIHSIFLQKEIYKKNYNYIIFDKFWMIRLNTIIKNGYDNTFTSVTSAKKNK